MKNYRPMESTAAVALALLVSAVTVLAAACQKLDPNLASGPLSGPGGMGATGGRGGAGGSLIPGMVGTGGVGVPASACPTVRMQAHAILEANCSICHQAPGTPTLYLGSFNFILDLAQLTSSTSPQSSTTLTLKYVVKGRPDQSYIYQRISNNSMPPITRTQRPVAADRQVLDQWITNCIDDPTSPQGWSGPSAPADAGVDSGPQLEGCGPANVCPGRGCCVFNQCR